MGARERGPCGLWTRLVFTPLPPCSPPGAVLSGHQSLLTSEGLHAEGRLVVASDPEELPGPHLPSSLPCPVLSSSVLFWALLDSGQPGPGARCPLSGGRWLPARSVPCSSLQRCDGTCRLGFSS